MVADTSDPSVDWSKPDRPRSLREYRLRTRTKERARSPVLEFYFRFFVSVLISTIFIFPQFGINLGAYSLNFSLVAIYAVLAYGVCCGMFRMVLPRAIMFCLVVVFGLSSLRANYWGPSAASFFLLAVIHFPLVFAANPQTTERWRPFATKLFCDYAAIIAVIAGIQFMAQFATRAEFVFGFYKFIPDPIKATGVFNTVIEVGGGLKKANGFFLREPSFLSQNCAIALLIEYFYFRRKIRMLLLLGGMAVSLSGTGIIILIFGFFFPLNLKSVVRFVLIGALAIIGFMLVSEILNLSIFTSRLAEFQTTGTSGYARFIAPYILIVQELNYPEWAAWIGHGPGSITPAAAVLQAIGGAHDPTWAKAIFEYGFVGALSILMLVLSSFWGSWAPIELRVGILYAWLASGGQLLSPDFVAILFIVITLWPNTDRLAARVTSRHVPR